jgi:hypothetical protein
VRVDGTGVLVDGTDVLGGGTDILVGCIGVLVAGLLDLAVAVGCGTLVEPIRVAIGGFVAVAGTPVATTRVGVEPLVGVLPGMAVAGGATVPGNPAVADGASAVESG